MTARGIIRGFAWLDLVVTAAFATPWTASLVLGALFAIHAALLGAAPEWPALNSLTMAFINIMGVIGVVWALARLRQPSLGLARLDGWGRLAVALILLVHVADGLSPVFLAFVVTELAGTVAQLRLKADDSVKA